MSNEVAVIETSLGNIEFELLEDVAPGHVQNFKDLANSDFYNGTKQQHQIYSRHHACRPWCRWRCAVYSFFA